MPPRSPLSSVMPALSIATSVPVPMAMPTSAAASAGASLTPSPAIATMRPSLLQLRRPPRSSAPAALRPRPRRCRALRATASAVVRLSPVSMTTRMPSAASAFSASGVVALIGSAMASTPASLPSTATKIAVAPSRAQRSLWRLQRAWRRCRASARKSALPSTIVLPSTVPITPLPVGESKSSTLPQARAAFLRRRDDRGGQRMLAGALDAGGEPQHSASSKPVAATIAITSACPRSACRSCRPPACRPSPSAPAPRRS